MDKRQRPDAISKADRRTFLKLIGTPATRYLYDVAANGQRFLVNVVEEASGVEPLTLVVNWTAALPR